VPLTESVGVTLGCAGCACILVSIPPRRHAWSHAGIALMLISVAVTREWPYMAAVAVAVLADLYVHWVRRKRKRMPKATGAKSRSRIASLVGTMRGRVRHRPVLRPAPDARSPGSVFVCSGYPGPWRGKSWVIIGWLAWAVPSWLGAR
jgi:hypothetical protein